ncbi:MAG: response regulator transcription factor [Acidobacteriota bacterium]
MARILVCDDTPDILEMIRFILEKEGYSVGTAESGTELLDQLRREPADLVLLDLRMPGMDGFAALREMAKLRNRPPVLVLSAKGQEADRRSAIEAGALNFIEKPFSLVRLLAAVRGGLLSPKGNP